MTKTERLFDESEGAQRLLAKLAPGALDPRRVRSASSLDRLAPADIAAAVAMLRRPGPNGTSIPDRFAQALVLYKWPVTTTPRRTGGWCAAAPIDLGQ